MFGFNEFTHKEFKNNFLKSVVFQFTFNSIEQFKDKQEQIISIFSNKFPLVKSPSIGGMEILFNNNETPILQSVKDDTIIELKSQDKQRTLSISSSTLSLTISGREYKNYSGLSGLFPYINEFLKVSDIKETHRIAIRKINIIEANSTLENNPNEILNFVINEQLISDLNYLPDSKIIKQNMYVLRLNNENYNLNLKYGLNVPQTPLQIINQVIIDIDLFNNATLPSNELFGIADNINKEIFNIFNWVINDSFLNLLNE